MDSPTGILELPFMQLLEEYQTNFRSMDVSMVVFVRTKSCTKSRMFLGSTSLSKVY